MKTFNDLKQQWDGCHGQGQVLVDSTHPLRMLLNINDSSNKELLVPVIKDDKQFSNTIAIGIRNYKNDRQQYLAIELINPSYEAEYMSLCLDLIESSRQANGEHEARRILFATLKKWYSLMALLKPGILGEKEIRGLMGEIKFILEELDRGKDERTVIESWKIHRDSSRDFIYDNTWREIKTVEPSKNYITISSLEQLELDTEGKLIVYFLEKTSTDDEDGINLNQLVTSLKSILGFEAERELEKKLLQKGYTYSKEYEDFRFRFVDKSEFRVDSEFPKITKETVDRAIVRCKYDLLLNRIEKWRIV